MSKKVDANDLNDEQLHQRLEAGVRAGREKSRQEAGIVSLRQLTQEVGVGYEPPIIDGLLRRGEVMNLIAPPKVGKSWLAYYIALSVACGTQLFDRWTTHRGPVAILDNELHKKTISTRLNRTHAAMELPDSAMDGIYIIALRGCLKSIGVKKDGQDDGPDQLARTMTVLKSVKPKLVIIDSLYRILPLGTSENDNAQIAQVMNRIDEYAAMLDGAGLILVHHTSKGSQASKGVTDVGSGAGALSRACDSHLILREHSLDDHYVLQAVTRTFQKPEPLVIRRGFPLWHSTDESTRGLAGSKNTETPDPELGRTLTLDAYLTGNAMTRQQVQSAIIKRDGCAIHKARLAVLDTMSDYGLHDLISQDEPKDCGAFEAWKVGQTMMFRLKAKE